jgi:hypothetical protein
LGVFVANDFDGAILSLPRVDDFVRIASMEGFFYRVEEPGISFFHREKLEAAESLFGISQVPEFVG